MQAGVEQGMKGSTALGTDMHINIKKFLCAGIFQPAAVQKTYIRAMSIPQLLDQYLSFSANPEELSAQIVGVDDLTKGDCFGSL